MSALVIGEPQRLPPSCSRRPRFSATRYSITACWLRWIQRATEVPGQVSGPLSPTPLVSQSSIFLGAGQVIPIPSPSLAIFRRTDLCAPLASPCGILLPLARPAPSRAGVRHHWRDDAAKEITDETTTAAAIGAGEPLRPLAGVGTRGLIAVLAGELALAYEAGDLGAARVAHRAIGALIGDDSRGVTGLVTPAIRSSLCMSPIEAKAPWAIGGLRKPSPTDGDWGN